MLIRDKVLRAIDDHPRTPPEIHRACGVEFLDDVVNVLNSARFRRDNFIERISRGRPRWCVYRRLPPPVIPIRAGMALRDIECAVVALTLRYTAGRKDLAREVLKIGDDKFNAIYARI